MIFGRPRGCTPVRAAVLICIIIGLGYSDIDSNRSRPGAFVAKQYRRRLQCQAESLADVGMLARCYPCAVPDVDPCIYDIGPCRNMKPGDVCEIHCKDPYIGELTNGFCPGSNIDPSKMLEHELPNCKFDRCPDPPQILWPTGYYFNPNSREWSCAYGYGGQVVRSCYTDPSNCVERAAAFSGCLPLRPCSVPSLTPTTCDLDWSSCVILPPGATCAVTCRYPFKGALGIGECPAGNIKHTNVILTAPPVCEFDCPSLLSSAPPGYESFQGQWRCGEGYVGDAEKKCEVDDQCNALIGLVGCIEIIPCAAFQIEGSCEVDASHCPSELMSGQSCKLRCKSPYEGISGAVSCPPGNIDPSRPVEIVLPQCYTACGEPRYPPRGYEFYSTPASYTGVWRCDMPRYAGTVVKTCQIM